MMRRQNNVIKKHILAFLFTLLITSSIIILVSCSTQTETNNGEITITEPIVITTQVAVTTLADSVVTTTEEPVVTTTEEPVVTTTEEPVVTTTEEPVVTTTEEPVVTTTEEPVVTTTEEPVVTTTEEPVVTTIEEPVVTTTEEPVVTTTETTPIETTETIEHYYIKNQPYCLSIKTYKAKDRIYVFNNLRYYYDSYNDDTFIFCFDPLCNHKKATCIQNMFKNMSNFAICNEYDSRIYVPVGDNLFSFKTTGSDVRLEVSFSDYGKDLGTTTHLPISTNITNLFYFDNYVFFYFTTLDEKNNTSYQNFYKYDTFTKKLDQLTFNGSNSTTITKVSNIIGDNKMLISIFDNNYQYYVTDFDMNLLYRIDDEIYNAKSDNNVLFDGRYIYKSITSDIGSVICAYDTQTNSSKIIKKFDTKLHMIHFLDIDGEYIYYTYMDPFYIGTEIDRYGREKDIYNNYHTIYRISKDGKINEVFFEGVTSEDSSIPSYGVSQIAILNDRIWFMGTEYTNDDVVILQKTITDIYVIENGKMTMTSIFDDD